MIKDKDFLDIGERNLPLSKCEKIKLKTIRTFSSFLDYCVLFLAILAILICSYAFFDTNEIFNVSSTENYQMYKPDDKLDLSFNELLEKNKDICAWIDIYGTKIDYPVAHGKDNTEYINKTVLGEFATSGSIFLDSGNAPDFSDFSNILYGHFMERRKMFGDIELFKDENFFNTHKFGALHIRGKKSKGITIFALCKTVGDDFKILSPKKSYSKKLVDEIFKKAVFKRNIEIEEKDNILILDTCDLSFTNGRYILACKLTENVEKNTFTENKKENRFNSLLRKVYNLNFLKIIFLLWLLFFIMFLVYNILKKKKKEKENEKI